MDRAAIQEKQRLWMQERQAENDRRKAVQSLRSDAQTSEDPVDSAVLDRLTAQITERLQVEVRRENAKLMQEGAVGAQVESLLERHIGTNTCPICFELMAGKANQPTLLFPCGHTFCAACLRQHLEKQDRKTCPYCRQKVDSQAPNISLQQVIEGFVERQQTLARGEVLPEILEGQEAVASAKQRQYQPDLKAVGGTHAGAGCCLPSEGHDAQRYAEQYRAFSMRLRVMDNQLRDSQAEAAELQAQQKTAQAVLEHLQREQAAGEQRLEALRLELEVLRSQRAEQADKVATLERRQAERKKMEDVVGQTHASLEREQQKALLLVRNYSPRLAEQLLQESDPIGESQ